MHRLIATLTGAVLGVAALTAGSADAQPAPSDPPKVRAKYYYDEGRKQFDLGNFQKATESFKKAYEEWPDGAFLYNVASAYRQLDDCKQALFFYKRFLNVKKDAPEDKKKEVEGHIVNLEKCVKDLDAIRSRPPDGTVPPDGTIGDGTGTTGTGTTGTGTTGTGTTGTGTTGERVADPTGPGPEGEVDEPEEPEEPVGGQPKLVAVHAGFGGAVIGAGTLDIPPQVSIGLGVGYPIPLGPKMVLDAGLAFGFSPVPWSGSMGEQGNASFTTVLANAGLTYEVAPKISVRGELGAGMLLLGGLATGNPFTNNMQAATGALTMPTVRIALIGEYAFTQNVSAAVTPIGFSYSPAKEGLKDEISSLTRLEFTVGLGYRM